MRKAQQGLCADKPAVVDRYLGLIMQFESSVGDGVSQLGCQCQTMLGGPVQCLGMERVSTAAVALGKIHRSIGILQQFAGIDYVLCHMSVVHLVAAFLDEDRKLVATQSGWGVTLTQAFTQAMPCLLEQSVANVVPQRIVDTLEVVQVEEQKGDAIAVPDRLIDRMLQPVLEQGSVWQLRQRVAVGKKGGLFSGPADAAVQRPLERNRCRPANAYQQGHQHVLLIREFRFHGAYPGGLELRDLSSDTIDECTETGLEVSAQSIRQQIGIFLTRVEDLDRFAQGPAQFRM